MTDINTRSKRITSPEFRTFLGKALKEKRDLLGYTLEDVNFITKIPVKTIISIEKGVAINIDYYVEYSKAVLYDFAQLSTAGIDAKPQKELSKEDKKRTKLTSKVRRHIILKDFLEKGKTVDQILSELVQQETDLNGEITSIEIAGIMQNFIKDNTIRVLGRSGNKNIYVLYNTK